MSTQTIDIEFPRELDYRGSNGIHVWLLWLPADDRLVVRVVDVKSDLTFDVDADPANALDVFHHPFAYATEVPMATLEAEIEV